MTAVNIDARLENADWPKRTPDKFADLIPALKYDPTQPRDEKGRWKDLGLHGDQVTLLHGTTRQNAEAILSGGFKPGNPASIAARMEREYGLPEGGIFNHVAFEFARGRRDLGEVHFTTDESVADQYSIPEVVQDALTSAHMLLYPLPEDVPFTKERREQRQAWIAAEAKRLMEPALLAVTVPFDVVGQHGFGKQFTLDEFKALLTKFPDAHEDIFNNIRLPIAALTGVKIQRRKWDPNQPRGKGGRWVQSAMITVGDRQIEVVKPQRAVKAGDKLVPLNVIAFDTEFQRQTGFYLDVGGKGGIGNRYERFGEYIARHDSIEAAEVSVREDGTVGFTNGRHRYAWLRDQGLTSIPVAMTPESVKHAKKHGMLAAVKLAWDESQHPRDKEGQFSESKITIHTKGRVQLPGRYDTTEIPAGNVVVVSEKGYLALGKSNIPNTKWVSHVYVKDEFRRQGEATRLYEAGLKAVQDMGMEGIVRGDMPLNPGSLGMSPDAAALWAKFEKAGRTEMRKDSHGRDRMVLVKPAVQKWEESQHPRDAEGQFTATVYHGTGTNFSTFDLGRGGEATGAKNGVLGAFFTTDLTKAEALYAGRRGTVIQAQLALKHPARFRGLEYDNDASALVNSETAAYVEKPLDDLTEEDFLEWRDFLIRQGHDGIEVKLHHGETDYIVFDAKQVRRIKWEESQHPRDAEGQFTESGLVVRTADLGRKFAEMFAGAKAAPVISGIPSTLPKDIVHFFGAYKPFVKDGKPAEGGLIYVHPKMADPTWVDEQAKKQPKIVSTSIEATVAHEYGHHLTNQLIILHPKLAQEMVDYVTAPIEKKGWFRTKTQARWQQDDLNGRSQYATTNVQEFIAEAFTDGYLNWDKASESGKFIYGLMQRAFGSTQKFDPNQPRDEQGQWTKTAIRSGQAHTVSEDEFLKYHHTGHIPSDAYERYEAGDMDFIHRKEFETLLDTREVNGQTVEIRLQTEHPTYSKRREALPEAERERLYWEYEQEAKRLGTTTMMAGIDLGWGSEAYKALGEFEKRWRDSGEDYVRDAQGNLVPLTPEEVKAKGYPTETYTVGAFVGDKAVGYAGDEFGASGVYVARAFQRHGLGLALFKTYLEKSGRLAKGQKIGQMTGAGTELVRALHRQLVKEAKKSDLVQSIAKQEHQFGNTQILIDPLSSAAASLNAARDAIKTKDLMGTGKDVDQNHVTVRYGLVNEDLDKLRAFIAGQQPFEARVLGIELFPASEHSEGAVPVVARIASPELREIEQEIGKYADFKEKSFPEYKPHCTLAYCKPKAAEKYRDLYVDGSFIVQSITISHQSGTHETIVFGQAVKFDPNQPRDAEGQWTAVTLTKENIDKVMDGIRRSVSLGVVVLMANLVKYPDLPKSLHVQLIAIDDYFQRKGLGTKVMDKVERLAEHNGLIVTLAAMTPASKAFFSKRGYTATEQQSDLPGAGLFMVKTFPAKKKDPISGRYVTPFVSFEKQGDEQLRMIASLNSSRLATWGFTAEAEVRGMARYRLTAVLDGRTSEFCRIVDGKIFYVEDARRKVIEALNVQNPEDLKVVQPWPKQTKAALALFREMTPEELTARGLHIPPYHPHCRTICRVIEGSQGEEMEDVEMLPEETETFQAVTQADLQEMGIEATPEQVAEWNAHIGMSPVELFSKLTGLPPQETMTKGVGTTPVTFEESGNIALNARGQVDSGVAFKLGAILDPFTGIFYLTQADLLAGTPAAETKFLKNLFSALIETGLKSSATTVAVGVAGNAAYYAKLGFLPDELEWDVLRSYASMELETGVLKPLLETLSVEDRLLVQHLLQDSSVSALSALVDLPFIYEGKTLGEWLLAETAGVWGLDLTDLTLVSQAKAYLT